MTWSDPRFAGVAAVLRSAIGLDFPDSRRAFAEAAIRHAMAKAHERDTATYTARLCTEGALLEALIAEVTVGETYFFRDAPQFAQVAETIVPAVLRGLPPDVPLQAWSAGCASGEEAYSLAMVLDAGGNAGRARILASDVSAGAIERARRHHYGAWSFRDPLPIERERYFSRSGKRWLLAPRIASMVTFVVHNVLGGPPVETPAGGFDVILCRNVLIYLDAEAIARVARGLTAALSAGGWLLTSPTDPMLTEHARLDALQTAAGLVYRRALPVWSLHEPAAAPPQPRNAGPVVRRVQPPLQRPPHTPLPSLPALDPEHYVESALRALDAGEPADAALAARRALYIDRSLEIAHLALGRALRLLGSYRAARRSLERGGTLLAAGDAASPARSGGGVSVGSLCAVAAAELALLPPESKR